MKPQDIKNQLLVMMMVMISSSLYAQSGGTAKVKGRLVDVSGKPMEYATVLLQQPGDSLFTKSTLSRDSGYFTLDYVKAGVYRIEATNIGYHAAQSDTFRVAPGASVQVPDLKMSADVNELSTVTIVAKKPLIEVATDRTIMNVAGSVLSAGNSAMEILARAPGISVDKDGNISLNGNPGITVMINDKLTYLSAAQLATLLRSTDGTTIQSIELITNPSAKYDASGNSGIINIKLKKSKQTGTNGNITLGAGYGMYGKENSTLFLNHQQGNLNVFGTFSHDDDKTTSNSNLKRLVTDSLGKKTYFNQFSSPVQNMHDNSYRVGADYDMSSKNIISFVVNGYFNIEQLGANNPTYIGSQPGEVDSYQRTLSNVDDHYKSFAANVNDRFKIDSAGQGLSVDLDYSKFNNSSNAQYNTFFYTPDGTNAATPLMLRQQTPSVIAVRVAKVDYTLPVTKTLKLDAGVKYSDVKTDNNLQAQNQVNGNYVNDTTLSNRFVYDEKIAAGYFSLSQHFKNTTIHAGLRAEHTSSTGDLYTTDEVVTRHYLDFFPSVFINHTLDDKNQVGVSYSRRIDRPSYDALNPFTYYIDQYTYLQGNPFLKAQYTDKFELTYLYNHSISVSAGYSHTSDAITTILLTIPATKVTDQTSVNLASRNNYHINVFVPYNVTDWWTGNANVTGFYVGYRSPGLLGATLNSGQAAFIAKTTQTFEPVKSYRLEMMDSYASGMTANIYHIKPVFSSDAGISHSFADKKTILKLSVSDIFNSEHQYVTANYQSDNLNIRQKYETRITRLTLTYNFGSDKMKAREHINGSDDLINRVKGAN